ncbi:MAG: DUF1858 domain-containing protein [bacterium]
MTDSTSKPAITPDLKVAKLLFEYPELEEVLIGIAPAFKKLRNPVLRKTVARITSLRQAARVGGVSVGALVNKLRVAAGQEEAFLGEEGGDAASTERPAWVQSSTVELFDAREAIEGGGHPLPQALAAVDKLEAGHAFAIVTPFLPAPMIDKIEQKGFRSWTEQKGPEHFVTYFAKPEES